MSTFDADDGGEISFKEFVKLMTQKPCENDTVEDIERIFEYIDEDNKGFISEEDLMQMAEELHEEVSKQELNDMINYCDPQGKGIITKEAFIAFNKRKNFE
jgi:Ca2+-binding EF-hand superfamily protein